MQAVWTLTVRRQTFINPFVALVCGGSSCTGCVALDGKLQALEEGAGKRCSERAWAVQWQTLTRLSPFLTGRMFVRRTHFGHFDEL